MEKATGRLARNVVITLILITNIGCDQISKNIVRQKVGFYERIDIIKDHLTVTYVENPGAFLSIGSSLPPALRLTILSVIPLITLLFGIFYLLTQRSLTRMSTLALSFAIGGGIGNIYDRMIHGSVTDFLHVKFGIVQTGIFNMADVSIVTGMLIFFVQAYSRQARRLLRYTK
ncbi:signal peptidase II [Dyadobacter sandarakinus]|uniref:Lipoprotein signal peptidase n=1 Tax=Dyadobacter sandarakinus TaxID=2747268 RepID=A0ABX7IF14_9BACT|nr:signal peptidase II [Dyadobacter sandarakinus]